MSARNTAVGNLWRCVLMALCVASMTALANGRYQIDPIETKTSYETRYLGFFSVYGVFDRMTGVMRYDTTKPAAERDAFIHVVIDATTLRALSFNSKAKREMLRGPEFFNIEKYPAIEFVSSAFRFDAGKLIAIDGHMTLTGVIKPVSLTVVKSGCEPASSQRAARCTATAEVVINRTEFGMTGWAATVSDQVKIAVELVAIADQNGKPAAAPVIINTQRPADSANGATPAAPVPATAPAATASVPTVSAKN